MQREGKRSTRKIKKIENTNARLPRPDPNRRPTLEERKRINAAVRKAATDEYGGLPTEEEGKEKKRTNYKFRTSG